MRYTTLGDTGLEVSRLALGSMTFGRETGEEESHAILDAFVDAGGTLVDTADGYTEGAAETIIGRWLAGRDRHDLVLATKVRFGEGRNRRGLGRKHILAAIDASLRRLGTDHVDLYQIHMWDARTPVEETWSTLDGLVAAGKVRYLGVSNVAGWQLQRIVDLCRAEGWQAPVSLQPLYNLLDREAEWELLPAARHSGIGVIPWSPLRGGWLTGKLTPEGAASEQTRVQPDAPAERSWTEEWTNYATPRTWAVLDALRGVADDLGRTPAEVALNWLLQQPGVTAPILGARTVDQLRAHLGVADWDLAAEQLSVLDEVSDQTAPYPYGLLSDLVDA